MIETTYQAFDELLQHGFTLESLPFVCHSIRESRFVSQSMHYHWYMECGGTKEKWLEIVEVLIKYKPEKTAADWHSEGF